MQATKRKLHKQPPEPAKILPWPPMAYLHDLAQRDEQALAGDRQLRSRHGNLLTSSGKSKKGAQG